MQYLERDQLRCELREMYFVALCCRISRRNLMGVFTQSKLYKTRPQFTWPEYKNRLIRPPTGLERLVKRLRNFLCRSVYCTILALHCRTGAMFFLRFSGERGQARGARVSHFALASRLPSLA